MHNGNWNDRVGDSNWGWLPMVIMMVLFWGSLVWLGFALLKRNHHATEPQMPAAPPTPLASVQPTAQEILAERLARGDIEPDDYRQRLEALRVPTKS